MRALDGSEYMPGLVGLNNMSRNDYVNVIIQAGPWQQPTSISDSHSYSVSLSVKKGARTTLHCRTIAQFISCLDFSCDGENKTEGNSAPLQSCRDALL